MSKTMAAATTLALVAGAAPARAWSPLVQQTIARGAIDNLPKPMKAYYEKHRLEIPCLALEPSFPERGPERRFAVDRLLPFPFADLPHSEAALKQRFGEGAEQAGRLPWLVVESYERLREAFRAVDKDKILTESDNLAALVTDLHNPLALTENFDGQKTEQHGLWVRFTQKFPESLQKDLKVDSEGSFFLDDPKEYVFSIVNQSYVWVDNVLYFDDLARRGKPGYGTIYYEDLKIKALPLLKMRLSQAARDAASYWYTAWTAAGRPELK